MQCGLKYQIINKETKHFVFAYSLYFTICHTQNSLLKSLFMSFINIIQLGLYFYKMLETVCLYITRVRSDKYRTGIITIVPVRTTTINL